MAPSSPRRDGRRAPRGRPAAPGRLRRAARDGLLELGAQAKAAGKATGLVTSAQVTDASPAAWFAQTPDRGQQDEIARQYLEVSKPDVILGGGEDWWLPAGTPGAFPDQPAEDPTEGSKGTGGDLIAEARKLGYDYASTSAAA